VWENLLIRCVKAANCLRNWVCFGESTGHHHWVSARWSACQRQDQAGRRRQGRRHGPARPEELTREPGYWTEGPGWSPDGKAARLTRYWKSDEVAKWEEQHKDFTYLIDLRSGKATKQTPVEDKKASTLVKNLVHGRSISPDGKRCAYEDRA
jgi:hypothetical protein